MSHFIDFEIHEAFLSLDLSLMASLYIFSTSVKSIARFIEFEFKFDRA